MTRSRLTPGLPPVELQLLLLGEFLLDLVVNALDEDVFNSNLS